jgi:nitrogen fixation protein NifU and related proteins
MATDASLEALYQETILDHNRRPRNFRELEDATGHSEGRNPLCGDQVSVWVKVDGDRIAEATFKGQGCAIAKASASLMTAAIAGKSKDEVNAIFDHFHAMVTGKEAADPSLGSLKVLGGVSKYPIRVKCATLAWHAMKAAIDGSQDAAVSTE